MTPRTALLILTGSIAFLLGLPAVHAATFTWDGGSAFDSNIGTADNWNPNGAPTSNLATTDLVFDGTLRLNPNFLTTFSAAGITFNNTAAANAFTFGGSGLTIGTTGIVNNDANTQTFGNTVSLGTVSTTFNAASGPLIFNGALGLGTSTLNVNGVGNTTLGTVNGTGTINKSGAGTLSFQPVLTHIFDLVQTAGTVQTLSGGTTEFNTGSAVQINGGSFFALGNLTLDGATFTRSAGTFALAAGATLTVQNSGSFAFGASQAFSTGQTIAVTGGGQVTSGGFIDLGNGGVGTVNLSVSGAGSLLQTGSINDWGSGGASANVWFTNSAIGTLNGGLRLANTSAAGGAFMTVNLGAQVTTSSLAIGLSTGGAQATVNIDGVGSKLTVSGAGTTTIGAATGAAQSLSFFNNGTFESGTGALTIGATGTLNADGNFIANGDIIVNGIINRTFLSFPLTPGKNLTVQGGGDANLSSLTVSANSTATLTGAGSAYTGGVIMLAAPTAALNVSAGAVVNLTGGIGLHAAAGTVVIDGAGSQLNNVGGFASWIGDGGSAVVTFRNGATGTFGSFVDLSRFNSPNSSGTLNVESGADLTLQSIAIADNSTNTTGTMTLDGAGSTAVQIGASTLKIGKASSGAAALNINNGASFTTGTGNSGPLIFVNETGSVSLSGTGSTFLANAGLTLRGQILGGAGTNFTSNKSLSVEAGGDATFAKAPFFGSGSKVYVSGAGSTLTTIGGVELSFDNVHLEITGGGVVQSAQAVHTYGGSGVIVDGAGSQLRAATSSISFWVGDAVANSTSVAFRNGAAGIFGEVEFAHSFTAQHTKVVIESGADLTLAKLGPSFVGIATSDVNVTGAGSTLTATTGGIILGAAADRAGVLNISGGAVVTLAATGTNRLVLNPTGTVNLAGGTLALGEAISRLGGVLNFTAGAILLAEDLAVGPAGLLGANLTLTAAKQVTTSGLTQVDAFNTLTLDGGVLSTGTLANSGTIDFKKGALTVTGAGGFNIGTGALGAAVTLDTGANLAVTNATTVAAGGLLRLEGGSFIGGNVTNNGTIDHRDGALAFTGLLTNAAAGRLFVGGVAAPAGAIGNAGRITLQGGVGILGGAGAITNTGVISGDGTLAKPVTNAAGGEIRGEAGKTLLFTAANGVNSGRINLLGGIVQFTAPLANGASGQINGEGVIQFPTTPVPSSGSPTAGLDNAGRISFSGGDTQVYGTVQMLAGSHLVISGGATASFYDVFRHNGAEVKASANSALVFFGEVRGAGSFTGTGTVYLEGGYSPGNSPAAVVVDTSLVFGDATTLTLELGGLTAGSGYDQLVLGQNGALALNGTLLLDLLDGFIPAGGDTFQLFDFAPGQVTGGFDAIVLAEALPAGLSFDTTQLTTTGRIGVVPEPSSVALLFGGLALLGLARGRRK